MTWTPWRSSIATGETLKTLKNWHIFPASFVTPDGRRVKQEAVEEFAKVEERLEVFKHEGKLLEKRRLEARTRSTSKMLLEVGLRVENYARAGSAYARPASRHIRSLTSSPKISS